MMKLYIEKCRVLFVLVLMLTLWACGETGGGVDAIEGADDAGRVGEAPAVREPGEETSAQGQELLGAWEVLSQNGTLVRAGELSFTFMAGGEGMSLEGTSEKAFTWTYDPVQETLHIVTSNEDMTMRVAMAGETLTLVLTEPATTLVLRRVPDAGSGDVE